MSMRILPAGSIIYRARNALDESHHLKANRCDDTDKIGLYFSDCPILCMGMAIEYGVDIHLCTYRVERSIILYNGKYSFREINPERFFKNGKFIVDVKILRDENICHYDTDALPIYDGVSMHHMIRDENMFGEIFICEDELENLTLLDVKELSLKMVHDTLQ